MTILRIIFANKDPLLMYHMIKGGGDGISYKTLDEFLEYLDVYEAIQAQSDLEQKQEYERKRQEQETQKRGRR